MPKRRDTTAADVVAFFDRAPLDHAQVVLGIVKERMKVRRAPSPGAVQEQATQSTPPRRVRKATRPAHESEPPLPHLAGFLSGS